MKLNEKEESELQNLLELDANKTIDNHLKSHTYIKWNGLENDADFWQSLAYSLPHKKSQLPSGSLVTLMKRLFRRRTRPYLEEENPLNIIDEDFDDCTTDEYAQINSIAFMKGTKYEEIKHIV